MIGEPLKGHTSAVRSVAFSSDGAHIVSGSNDSTIRVWDAYTGKMIGEPLQGHTNVVMSVAYSSDGAHIVSGSADNTIRFWDTQTGRMIGEPLQGHTDAVWSVAFSPDGAHIASGSSDNAIRVARVGYISNDPYNSWVLDQDGFMLANGSKLLIYLALTAVCCPQGLYIPD
ncbi:WD40 repeat-like protein [Ceratobasidium sp. AG-I]|nr:WD40 repeat-like protein [Ceratobasidium sp. AG-I]